MDEPSVPCSAWDCCCHEEDLHTVTGEEGVLCATAVPVLGGRVLHVVVDLGVVQTADPDFDPQIVDLDLQTSDLDLQTFDLRIFDLDLVPPLLLGYREDCRPSRLECRDFPRSPCAGEVAPSVIFYYRNPEAMQEVWEPRDAWVRQTRRRTKVSSHAETWNTNKRALFCNQSILFLFSNRFFIHCLPVDHNNRKSTSSQCRSLYFSSMHSAFHLSSLFSAKFLLCCLAS